MLEALKKSYEYLPQIRGELDRRITIGQSEGVIEIVLYVNVHGQGTAVSKRIDLRQLEESSDYELEQLCRRIEEYVDSEPFIEGLLYPSYTRSK